MNVTNIIATAYKDFAQKPGTDMMKVARLLENFRSQVNEKHLFHTLENLKMDLTGHEDLIVPFVDLFRDYFKALRVEAFERIRDAFMKSQLEGVAEWLDFFTDGVIFYRPEIRIPLCEEEFPFEKEFEPELARYKKLNRLISGSSWIDAYPELEKLAANTTLSSFQSSCLQIVLGQIELYYYDDWQTAASRFKKAKELCPDNRRADLAAAEYEMRSDNPENAKNILLSIISKYPDWYPTYNMMGDCYKQETNLLAAEQWYNDAIRINSLQTESHSSLLKLYTDKSWFNEKGENCNAALKKIQTLEIFPKYDNELYHAYRNYAEGLSLNGKNREVIPLYEKAIRLRPDLGIAYVDAANFYIKQDKYLKALEKLDKAKNKDEQNFDVYWTLAYLYEQTSQNEKALEAYAKCRDLRPAWADQVCNFKGNLYFRMGDFETALSLFEEAISLNPSLQVYKENKADALINIAQNKEKEGKREEAEKIFASIDTVDNAVGLNTIGEHYFRIGRFDKAEECFAKAIKISDGVSKYHENIGLVFEETGREKEAEEAYLKACDLEKESGGPFNTLGYFYFSKGQWSNAITYYLIACEKDPQNSVYIQNLIRAYGDCGDVENALEYSKKLFDLFSTAENQAQYASYLLVAGKFDEALAEAKSALKKNGQGNDGETIYVIRIAASIFEETGNTKKAIELYKDVVERSENKDDYSFNQLGVLNFQAGKVKEAVSFYKAALELVPDAPVYNSNIALAYEALKLFPEAEAIYEKMIELDKGDHKSYNNLGVTQFKQGNLVEAEANYLKAVSEGGQQPAYLENLAVLYRQKGDAEKAIDYFEKLLAVEPDNAVNQNDLGVLYFQKGMNDKAIEKYNEAIKLKPEVSLYHENLGIAYEAKGDSQNALQCYEKALDLTQDKPRLYSRLGTFYYNDKEKNLDKAIEYYSKAVTAEPKNEQYVENLAVTLMESGNLKKEEKYIRQLLKINPNHFNAWNELGVLAYKKAKYNEAVDYYQKAAAINGNISVIHKNIADAFFAAGEFEKAAEYFQKAIDLDPDNIADLELSLANVYFYGLAKYDKSIPIYESVLEKAPDDLVVLKQLESAYKAVNDVKNFSRINKMIVATEKVQ